VIIKTTNEHVHEVTVLDNLRSIDPKAETDQEKPTSADDDNIVAEQKSVMQGKTNVSNISAGRESLVGIDQKDTEKN